MGSGLPLPRARRTPRRAPEAALLAALFLGAGGPEASVPGPVADVVARVQPAVVSISVSKPGGHEFAWGRSEGYRRPGPSAVRYGSGVIIDTAGSVLTNNHVVDGAARIEVTLSTGVELSARILGQDPETDLALLALDVAVPLTGGHVAPLGDWDWVRIGDWVIAFGSPLGYEHTVSVGVISARGRRLERIEGGSPPSFQDFLQTDASINPGNSGGPLVDLSGRVVAITTAYNPGGNGIGFAIPINLAARVASELRARGEVVRGYLGVHAQDLTVDIREALGLGAGEGGVLVGEVQPGSPAEAGGVRRGDILLAIGEEPISDARGFLAFVEALEAEQAVDVRVLRKGEIRVLAVTPSRRAPQAAAAAEVEAGPDRADRIGIEVQNRWGLESSRLGIAKSGQGVVITYVVPGGAADRKGLSRGDVILEVGGRDVWQVKDYAEAVAAQDRGRPVLLLVQRKDHPRTNYVAVRPLTEPENN